MASLRDGVDERAAGDKPAAYLAPYDLSGGVVVELAPHEVWAAYVWGSLRRRYSLEHGLQPKHGRPDGDEWSADVDAIAAELAGAKSVDRYWMDNSGRDPDGDVGSIAPKLHIRHTTRDAGRLILRPSDPDEGAFLLVTGSIPRFVVVGWITGREGKAVGDKFDGNGRPPCVMVPQSALRPIEELRQPLAASPVEQPALDEYCTICGERKTDGECPNADNSVHQETAAP